MAPAATTKTMAPAASRQIQCHKCGRNMRSRLLANGETKRHYCEVCAKGNRLCEVRYHWDKHANGLCGRDKNACAYCGSGLKLVCDPDDRDIGRMMQEDEEDEPCSYLEILCPLWFEKLHRGMLEDLATFDKDVVSEAWGWSDKFREVGGEYYCEDCISYSHMLFNGSYQFGTTWVEIKLVETAEYFAQHYFEMHDGREGERGRARYLDACHSMVSALNGLETFSFRCRELKYNDRKDDLLPLLGELRRRFVSDMHYKANAAYDKEEYDDVMEHFDGVEKNIREGFK